MLSLWCLMEYCGSMMYQLKSVNCACRDWEANKRGRDRCLGTRAVNKREERGREYRREGGREGRIERESRWVRPF